MAFSSLRTPTLHHYYYHLISVRRFIITKFSYLHLLYVYTREWDRLPGFDGVNK